MAFWPIDEQEGTERNQKGKGKVSGGRGRGRGAAAEWSNEAVHQKILEQRNRQKARLASARKTNRNKLIGKEKNKANDGW
jgi:hypothetical protein